jgi:protein TonB
MNLFAISRDFNGMMQSNFTRRERAAIAIATLAFIVVSAAAHFTFGAIAHALLPHWAHSQAGQIAYSMTVNTMAPSPTPTPKPMPTPTPRPVHRRPDASRTSSPNAQRTSRPNVPVTRATFAPGRESPQPVDLTSPIPASTTTAVPTTEPTPQNTSPQIAAPSTFRKKVAPEYSSICIDQGATGRVIVEVTIGPDGSLVSATVGQTSGFACLDDAALAAAKESTYTVPEVDGRPATERYLIVYDFSLDS